MIYLLFPFIFYLLKYIYNNININDYNINNNYNINISDNNNIHLAVICDGNRRYGLKKYKSSKLGHYLDTLSDVIIGFVFLYFILKKIFNFSFNTVLIIFLICLYIFNSKTNFIYSHDKMKNKNNNNNIFNKIIGFLTNNSYLYFIFIIILQNTYLA